MKKEILFEALLAVFTVSNGKLMVLLERRKEEPYKGYWMLPSEFVGDCSLDDVVNDIIDKKIGVSISYIEQDYTFSNVDRVSDNRVIATSYVGLVDSKSYEMKNGVKGVEKEWFSIGEIPKMAFDHFAVIDKAISKLKRILVNTNVLKSLFPSDFTLPELQNVYESIMNVKFDRRNFRKKFIGLGLIEDTGYNSSGFSGRPAKLYRFKENIKEINLF